MKNKSKVKKIVSFQIVQGADNWTPDVIAMTEDGGVYQLSLKRFEHDSSTQWKRLPDIKECECD